MTASCRPSARFAPLLRDSGQFAAPVITIADTATDEMVVTSEEPKARRGRARRGIIAFERKVSVVE